MGGMHADANAFRQHAYHPQQAMINVDGSTNLDQAYINVEGAMLGSDYITANGYYPPPQAPRLTAAAARASSMAAMYYNPALHPQHAFSSNVGGVGPWMPPYRSKNMANAAAPPAYHHQQVEHHLMAQKPVSAYQPGLSNAPGYDPQHQQQQQQISHYQARHSYPDDRQHPQYRQWNNAPQHPTGGWGWDDASYGQSQRQISDTTPTAYNARQASSYFHYPKQQQQQGIAVESAPAPLSHSHSQSLSQPQLSRLSDSGWGNSAQGDGWNGQGAEWRAPYGPTGYHGNWQDGPGWTQSHGELMRYCPHEFDDVRAHRDPALSFPGNSTWNRNGPVDDPTQWVDQGHYQQTSMAGASLDPTITAPAPVYHTQPDVTGVVIAGRAAETSETAAAAAAEADHQNVTAAAGKTNCGPAPPSPGTLDKSSVPISNIGAEIVWSACAALLEPGLLDVCAKSDMEELKTARGRQSNESPSSDRDRSNDALHSSLFQHRNHRTTCKLQPLQRLAMGTGDAAASSEESSASSSEPGTPPSSFPAYLYEDVNRSGGGYREKVKSLSTIQDLRGLGLSPIQSTFSRASRNNVSPRVYSFNTVSTPHFERKASQDRLGESVAGVLNLISPSWKWSINDDKLESLTSSLRDGAKVNASQAQKPNTYSAMKRSSSSNTNRANSPHGEQGQFPNGSAAPGSEPSPAFRRFAHQVLAQTLVSPTAFMLAMMYSLRVPYLAIQTNSEGVAQLDPEAIEIFAQPPSAAPFKLFTLGLMIANKHLDDNTFLNKTWNEVTGISLSELNRMERWFLEKSSYEITVPEEPWVEFLERLAIRTENKLANHSEAKRYRVPTKHRPSASVPNLPNVTASSKGTGGASNEETLKRLLLSIEEALVVIGRIAPFELSNSDTTTMPHAVRGPKRHSSTSPDFNILSDSERPNTSLHLLHHHCHSAPALAQRPNVTNDADLDVFEDENGPYRPQGPSVRSSMDRPHHRNGNLESSLNRSISENSATSDWHQQQRAKSMSSDTKMTEAPLAPSVLLDLLNRGQHLAHAAH